MNILGQCMCQKSSWSLSEIPLWSAYCHCDDCRRVCSAPVTAWLGVKADSFDWISASSLKVFKSSPGVRRFFCGDCGTPLAFEADHYEGMMHLYAANLLNPELFPPQFHVNYKSKLSWLAIEDDLPKYDGTVKESEL